MQTDVELVKDAKNGNYQCELEIFLRYKNLLRKVCRSYFLAGGEVEDLMQEAMIGLYKAIKGFSVEKNDNFASFASLCVHRQVQTAIKKANLQSNLILSTALPLIYESSFDEESENLEEKIPSNELTPEQLAISKETVCEIKELIKQKLSLMEIKIFNQYLKGKSYAEIAQDFSVSNKSIDNALSRIKKKLQFLKESV